MSESRINYDRQNLTSDVTAGTASAFVTIPDALASAILAGVNPIQGLYALMIGTPIAAITLSSEFMYVANTGALAVAVGDAVGQYSGDEQLLALAALTLCVGLFQLILGLFKLGGITKYISNAVMTGFMTGVALNIILGQFGTFTGYTSSYSNDVIAGIDTLFRPGQWNWPTFLTGMLTIVLIVGLGRTRLKNFSMIIAIIGASIIVGVFNMEMVQVVGDIADIPRGLPRPTLPDLAFIPTMLPSAIAVGLIGLVQAVGVSKTVPNSDGNFPNVSRDFAGQGLANTANGFFQALPIGGTMSETSVSMSAGAKTRFANIFSAILIIVVVLLFADWIELVAMPAVAALLIVAGYEAINVADIEDVRDTGLAPRLIMIITFIATLVWPLQYAVFLGVVLSVLQYLGQSARDVWLTSFVYDADGLLVEEEAPAAIAPNSVTLLRIYGSLYFAAAATLEETLPDVKEANHSVVILNLRGNQKVGSTFIKVIERYALKLKAQESKLMLSGVHKHVLQQIELTETTEMIAREDIFLAEARLAASTHKAWDAAQDWVVGKTMGIADE
jgi:SulP family sulfate permease